MHFYSVFKSPKQVTLYVTSFLSPQISVHFLFCRHKIVMIGPFTLLTLYLRVVSENVRGGGFNFFFVASCPERRGHLRLPFHITNEFMHVII